MALYPDTLNYISLCTGGSGLDLGIELAMPGARAVCLVEREAFAVATLVEAMENGLLAPAPVWSDARTLDGRAWRGIVDGVIGGIPCQPHSVAGKRLGAADERDLWPDARRIIVQSGAWWVLIENVGGMLTTGGAERVWRDLGRLGFAVEIGLFTASEVGAPHQRERLFILAVADDASGRWGIERFAGGLSQSTRAIGGRGCDLANARCEGLAGSELSGPSGERNGPETSRSAAEFHSPLLANPIGCGHDGRSEIAVGQSIERVAPERSGDTTELENASIARGGAISVQPGRQEQTGTDIDRRGIFPPGPGDLSGWRNTLESAPEFEPSIRRVADGLASRLDIGRLDRLRMLGNGVVPLQAAYAFRTLATRLSRISAGAALIARMME